jgi:hypothetical protein
MILKLGAKIAPSRFSGASVITEGPPCIEDPHDARHTQRDGREHYPPFTTPIMVFPSQGAIFPLLFDTVIQILLVASGRLHPLGGDFRASHGHGSPSGVDDAGTAARHYDAEMNGK